MASRSRFWRHALRNHGLCLFVFTITDFFAQWRRVYISTIVSSNSYPRGVYDVIHGSFGTQFYCPLERLLCVLTRAVCARVHQIWGIFLYCQFVISNALAQHSSRHFLSSLDALPGSSPFESFWRCYITYHTDLYFLAAQHLSPHFSTSLDALARSSPFGLFLALIHCLLHRLIFFDVLYLLEPSTLFYFSWTRITRSFS